MIQSRTACEPVPVEPAVPPRLRLIARRRDPRLNCPRCEAPTLVEIVRSGILVDRCRQCGGIWLDPGEFECFVGT